MSQNSIEVSGISKRYDLQGCRPSTFKQLIVGTFSRKARQASKGEIWALRDVSFSVREGEAIGVIGRNGSGKSTLLKILSRITEPTNGRATFRGRVGSLLEVGTGFHPELTGRQNIYLNGAILGMGRSEISRKLDEIVAFAEIEKFLDEPVKHYSSGMYVSLAFAVAANLDAEILLVDEVLAVGDVMFQKKCLSKMSDVTKKGRTILFVSHNMQAISQFTNRCILLRAGQCVFDGPTHQAISGYDMHSKVGERARFESTSIAPNRVVSVRVETSEGNGHHAWGKPITFEFIVEVGEPKPSLCFSFQIVNGMQQPVCHFWLFKDGPFRHRPGRYRFRCELPKLRLYMGDYTVTTWLAEFLQDRLIENVSGICAFTVAMDKRREEYDWHAGDCVYMDDADWSVLSE